jgi:hypothetical protein
LCGLNSITARGAFGVVGSFAAPSSKRRSRTSPSRSLGSMCDMFTVCFV